MQPPVADQGWSLPGAWLASLAGCSQRRFCQGVKLASFLPACSAGDKGTKQRLQAAGALEEGAVLFPGVPKGPAIACCGAESWGDDGSAVRAHPQPAWEVPSTSCCPPAFRPCCRAAPSRPLCVLQPCARCGSPGTEGGEPELIPRPCSLPQQAEQDGPDPWRDLRNLAGCYK